MNAVPIVLVALLVMVIAYRYYSAFLVAKVAALDDSRITPAKALKDGTNYHATNKYVLFGHHFAAISGAGPLIGPVLAAQYGYAPGLVWMLLGAVIAGGVHDFLILVASIRRQGKSLAEIARWEISPLAGIVASIAILIIIIVALAGLGVAVVNALSESSWGTFTIAMTIPAALMTGLWMYRIRPGHIVEASVIGVIGVFAAVILGGAVPGSWLGPAFTLTKKQVTLAIAAYGFIASVLPVWMLLCPRDYLSSYLKIGTIGALVLGVLVVHPDLKMPAVTQYVHGGGPVIAGKLFPFLFITIACGAISGFHSLVGSGTTPKMLSKESDARMIGYGAMLVEGVVSIIALIAACSLHPNDYFAINVEPTIAVVASDETHGVGLARSTDELLRAGDALTPKDRQTLKLGPEDGIGRIAGGSVSVAKVLALSPGALSSLGYQASTGERGALSLDRGDYARLGVSVSELPGLSRDVGEVVAARPGGAVSLAVGFAQIFAGLPGMKPLMSYWYHFAIMFEALFILTTIDTGTRVARFLVQEFGGRIYKPLERTDWLPGALFSTGLVVFGWGYFIWTGNISTIWPMFGTANQLLAAVALAVATAALINAGKVRYVWVTLVPLAFIAVTTLYAGWRNIFDNFLPLAKQPGKAFLGWVNVSLTVVIMGCVVIVLGESARRAWRVLAQGRYTRAGKEVSIAAPGFEPPEFGEA